MGSAEQEKPWYKTIAGVIGVGGGIIAAAFGVVFILCTLDLIPQCKDSNHPEVRSINPPELSPDQAAVIIGENLKRVSEVILTRPDRPPISVYILRPVDSKINFKLPQDVDPGVYNVELKMEGQELIATGRTLVVKDNPTPVLQIYARMIP